MSNSDENERRAQIGRDLARRYGKLHFFSYDSPTDKMVEENMRSIVKDAVADLLHFAESEGIDPETVIRTATHNFEMEQDFS